MLSRFAQPDPLSEGPDPIRRRLPACRARRAIVPGAWLLLELWTAPAAAQFCDSLPVTHCRAGGHSTLAASAYPYTEDIDPSIAGVTLTGPSLAWTDLESGCADLAGLNLNASQPFNALLRAQIYLAATTAAPGARYEVRLLVDNIVRGRYVRRLRGLLPQPDVFASTIQGVPAGRHAFRVQGRLLDPGTLNVTNAYITAQGSPAVYPSVRSAANAPLTLSTIRYKPLTNSVQFANTEPLDLAVQGYFQLDSGAPGQLLHIAAFLDGTRAGPVTYAGVPPYLYEGVNVFTVLTKIAPGQHTLSLNVMTDGLPASFSNRVVEFVAFPATTYSALVSDAAPLTIDSATAEAQPTYLDTACGLWTKLLETTIPPDATNGWYNQIYEGYVRLSGDATDLVGPPWGEVSFETFFSSGGTDGGGRNVQVAAYPDGAYLFGDTAMAADPDSTETIRFWARKVNPTCSPQNNRHQGSFKVLDRFFWVRHLQLGGGCLYP